MKRKRTFGEYIRDVKLRIYGRRVRKAIKKNPGNTNKILIIKHDGLGDFILFLDAAKELRRYYRDKHIVLSCQSLAVPIAKASEYFDEVITLPNDAFTLKNLDKTYKTIKNFKFDLLLHPNQPRNLNAERLAYLINAKIKIASLGECGALPIEVKEKCDKTYDRMIDQGIENMSIIQSAEFVRGLGDSTYRARLPHLEVVPKCFLYLPKDFYVVFVGGSVFNKLWPAERFVEVAKYINAKTGWTCVLCGAENDIWQEKVFSDNASFEFYSLIGKTSIDQLIYIISKSRLVVGNDTSAIHIANAVGIQALCIKGLFSGNKFYPYQIEDELPNDIFPAYVSCEMECFACTMRGRNYECIHDDYYADVKLPCILNINVDMVIEKLQKILERLV